MDGHEKPRDKASETLIELRSKMGKSQASFAVEVMKTAVTTIARWENDAPPRGETLLRLRDIAIEQKLFLLANKFELIYRQELEKPLLSELTWVGATQFQPAHGLLSISLPDPSALVAAHDFMVLLSQLDSSNPKVRKKAVSALASLREAAGQFDNPAANEIRNTFRAALSGAHEVTAKEVAHEKASRK
jgi:transcriptional regulator with XRE-family HTH domain